MSKKLPTQRSLEKLRELGFTAAVVERYNHHCRTRHDAFGFADLIVCHLKDGIAAIQACAAASQSARIAKIKAEPRALVWLKSGGRIFVHAWGKKGPRGKRKTWQVSETEIFKEDFSC